MSLPSPLPVASLHPQNIEAMISAKPTCSLGHQLGPNPLHPALAASRDGPSPLAPALGHNGPPIAHGPLPTSQGQHPARLRQESRAKPSSYVTHSAGPRCAVASPPCPPMAALAWGSEPARLCLCPVHRGPPQPKRRRRREEVGEDGEGVGAPLGSRCPPHPPADLPGRSASCLHGSPLPALATVTLLPVWKFFSLLRTHRPTL